MGAMGVLNLSSEPWGRFEWRPEVQVGYSQKKWGLSDRGTHELQVSWVKRATVSAQKGRH